MKLPTNKNFGITFGCVFFIIFIYFYFKHQINTINFVLIIISIIFFILGFLNSKLLHPFNYIWFKFGIFLSKIISPIILSIIFFLVVSPIGLLMKVLKKDPLNLKFNHKESYWIKKNNNSKMKNQF